MSSQLATIIQTIANQTVMDIDALQTNELPESVDSWRLPTRLILPIGGGRASGTFQQFATFKSGGAGVSVWDWTISDLLFYRAADAGIGLQDIAPILIDYCAAYAGALQPLRTEKWAITGVSFPIIGPFEWPAGGRTYDGVQVQLTIREIV